jgi:hypothetical protein
VNPKAFSIGTSCSAATVSNVALKSKAITPTMLPLATPDSKPAWACASAVVQDRLGRKPHWLPGRPLTFLRCSSRLPFMWDFNTLLNDDRMETGR